MALQAGFAEPDFARNPGWTPDPRCGYALGQYWLREDISREEHDAGVVLANLYSRVFGWGAARSNLAKLVCLGIGGYEPTMLEAASDLDAAPERALRAAFAALKRDQKHVVDVAVFGDHLPRAAMLPSLRRGLAALVKHWGIK